MTKEMKILEFKTVSPLFEMERDGIKPFTTRRIEDKDKRHRALSHWQPEYKWGIRIVNLATQESFIREIIAVSYLYYFDLRQKDFRERNARFENWRIIILGELIKATS
jgi:hypothetical protein